MNHNRKFLLRGAHSTLAAFLWIGLAGPVNADPTTSTSMTSRLGYVERLLTESSAAKKIDESGEPEALDLKAQANSRFDNARRANDSGDTETAQAELKEAIRRVCPALESSLDGRGDGRDSFRVLASEECRIDRVGHDDGLARVGEVIRPPPDEPRIDLRLIGEVDQRERPRCRGGASKHQYENEGGSQ